MNILTNPASAAGCLLAGGVVVYPAATFFALGCLAGNENAAELVCRVKGRDRLKPLPVIAGSMEQAACAVNLDSVPKKLLENFWPGALSILCPAKNLVQAAVNAAGEAAIRIDGNACARELALLAKGALTASSANISGFPAPARPEDLHPEFLRRLEELGSLAAIFLPPAPQAMPKGGLPSTIIELLPQNGDNALRIKRAGAIPVEALTQAGFRILP